MKTKEEILNELPTSWDTLKLKDYQKFSDITISETDSVFDGADNTISIISSLTDIPVDEIEEMPLGLIQIMASKLNFMLTPPVIDIKKNRIKIKKIEDISYDSYVTFIQLQKDPINNLDQLIKAFTVDISDEQLENISTQDAMVFFWSLRKVASKLIHVMISETKKRLKKQQKREAHFKMK